MVERVPNDHPSIHTVRTTVVQTATARHLQVPETDHDQVPRDEVVRVVLDGEERFMRPAHRLGSDDLTIAGIFETPSFARTPGEGTNLLASWLEAADVGVGTSVLLDVIEPDFQYGIRTPGESTIYRVADPPSKSLSSIADDLDGA